MTDDIERRLRALGPAPLPPVLRERLEQAVRASAWPGRTPSANIPLASRARPVFALAWAATVASAASIVFAVLAVSPPSRSPDRKPAGTDLTWAAVPDAVAPYTLGRLNRYLGDPDALMQMLDRQHALLPPSLVIDRTDLFGDTL